MKYSVDINFDDVPELLFEDKISFNNFDSNKSSCAFNLDNYIGSINFKEELIQGIVLYDWDSYFKSNTKLAGYSLAPIFSMHFMLSGCINYETSCFKSLVKGGQNNIWSLSEGELGYSRYKKEMLCSSWSVSFEEYFLNKLVNAYPDLLTGPYLRYKNGETFCLHKNYMPNTCEMNLIISQIKNAKLMGKTCHLYTEAKVMELLALQLQQQEDKKTKQNCLCYHKKKRNR